MASTKRTARTGHTKKYKPSAEQLAKDRALKKNLDQISGADLRVFDRALDEILKLDGGDEASKRWSKGAGKS